MCVTTPSYPLPNRNGDGAGKEGDTHVRDAHPAAGESSDGGPVPLVGVLVRGDVTAVWSDVARPVQQVFSWDAIVSKPHETERENTKKELKERGRRAWNAKHKTFYFV